MFEDLRDGINLVSLLEVLSGDRLVRNTQYFYIFSLQNIVIVSCANLLLYLAGFVLQFRYNDALINPTDTFILTFICVLVFADLYYFGSN